MKMDIRPAHSTYITPSFGDDRGPLDPRLQERMRRPMVIGWAIIATLVIGLGAWASLTPLASGISAQGEVRDESNTKTLRHKEGGIVRQIPVHEGDHVRAGQPLIVFDDVEARAANDVYQNQADTLMGQAARAQAEAADKPGIVFPAELTARAADPRVAGMMRDQQQLFTTRQQLYQSQTQVLMQRLDQIQNQVVGDQAQVASTNEQAKLTNEEMSGYQTLYAKGYAPKPMILERQRAIAELSGRKGSLLADIARLKQQMGETRMQLASLRDQRQSQAAEEVRDAQSKLSDTLPRLTAAKQSLDGIVVRSPVEGYVFNLTQFTVGGVTAPGEALMQIVPAHDALIVTAMIKPTDIQDIRAGMPAKVRLVGLNPRWNSPLPGKVVLVSADRISNEKTGQAFYRADVRIDAQDLARLKHGGHVTPGMPASVQIVTGKRTLMGFLITPITDTWEHAFHEQ